MSTYLEHANISVPDIDEAIAFIQTIAPDFKIRKDDSSGDDPPRWVHIGTDDSYIALQAVDPKHNPQERHRAYINYGINHLAFVVDDFDAVKARLEAKSYRGGLAPEQSPYRKRAYYFDNAGFEYEIVEYLTDNPAEKNFYST